LITGAARGIGRACAERLASDGATVIVTDLDPDGADEAAQAIDADPDRSARSHRLDVREPNEWSRVMAIVRAEHGPVGIVVNNAGITGFDPPAGPQDPEHASLESWRRVHTTNLDGVFLGCKHAIAAMKPPEGRGGSIVNISSRSGQVGIPRAAAYASSKAAVRNHTKSVALYCAELRYGIRCNSVHPGPILTPMWEQMLGSSPDERDAALRAIASEVPLQRMGTPEEVAAMVAYLASDGSSFVTGAEFTIDGGILAGSAATPGSDAGD
jgi:3(or 17)beta-hydroxysteroid dehydrogenase